LGVSDGGEVDGVHGILIEFSHSALVRKKSKKPKLLLKRVLFFQVFKAAQV
jgi:hypothetical protein